MRENVLFKRRNFNSERNLVKGLGGNLNSKKNSRGSQAGPGSHSLCFQLTLVVSERGDGWGARPSQILPDQLTLFKPGGSGADYAPPHYCVLAPSPPDFQTFLRTSKRQSLLWLVGQAANRFLHPACNDDASKSGNISLNTILPTNSFFLPTLKDGLVPTQGLQPCLYASGLLNYFLFLITEQD